MFKQHKIAFLLVHFLIQKDPVQINTVDALLLVHSTLFAISGQTKFGPKKVFIDKHPLKT